MDDLIPPEVVIVGGFQSRKSTSTTDVRTLDLPIMAQSTASHEYSSSDPNHHRHSYMSSISSNSLYSTMRDGRSQSSSMTSSSRRGSSPSLRESHDAQQQEYTYSAIRAAEAIKAERAKAKQDLKDKQAAIKALDKSDRILGRLPREPLDLSFADMLSASPPPPEAAQVTRETLALDKSALKAHAKALKAEEKARKEQVKMAKLKAAIQARNDKIDAHDRAVREKQAQKQALKQAKSEAARAQWNAQAKSASDAIWSSTHADSLLAKTRALQV